jgi:hypothetical protein
LVHERAPASTPTSAMGVAMSSGRYRINAMHSVRSQMWETASADDDEIEETIGIEPIAVRTRLPHFEIVETDVAVAAVVSGWRNYPTSAFILRLLPHETPARADGETVRRVVRVRVPIPAAWEARSDGDEVMGTRVAAAYCGYDGPGSLRKAKYARRIDSVGVNGNRELLWLKSSLDLLMGRLPPPVAAPSNEVELAVDVEVPCAGAAFAVSASAAATELSPVPVEVESPPSSRDETITPNVDLAATEEQERVLADVHEALQEVACVTVHAAVVDGPVELAAEGTSPTASDFIARFQVGTSRRWRPLGWLLLRLQPSPGESMRAPSRPGSQRINHSPSMSGHCRLHYVPAISICAMRLSCDHHLTPRGHREDELCGRSARSTPSSTCAECEIDWSSGEFASEGFGITP